MFRKNLPVELTDEQAAVRSARIDKVKTVAKTGAIIVGYSVMIATAAKLADVAVDKAFDKAFGPVEPEED